MEIPKYSYPVILIPGGCPQFLDFEFDMEAIGKELKLTRYFYEEPRLEKLPDDMQRHKFILHCLEGDEDGNYIDMVSGKPMPDPSYGKSAKNCLEPYYGQWVPLPVQRIKDKITKDGLPVFEEGPSNWARCYLAPSGGGAKLRMVLCFDTTVEEMPADANGRYYALSQRDVTDNAAFGLASHVRDNSWLLGEPWVDEWLLACYNEDLQRKRRRPGDEFVHEHLAVYLTFVDLLSRILPEDFRVKVIDPTREIPIDVDLILDLGNARTTGILVETLPQRSTNLNDSYLLQIRDLSSPELVYSEPFDTRVEFSEANFGNYLLSCRSGRSSAFPWPTSVRTGMEAARLSTLAKNAEGTTGMSSPKRYLWDERPWKTTWRINAHGGEERMAVRGSFAQQLNQEGTPLICFDEPEVRGNKILRKQEQEIAFEAEFTRSSIMMFLLAEIIMHALVTINSPAQRARRELPAFPRRLRRVIFTVPSGMSIAEQRIYRRWVKFAIRTLWEALGWGAHYINPSKRDALNKGKDYRQNPELHSSLDEATCTQLVYLYNEISRKYYGEAHQFFHTTGKMRPECSPYHSLRVACLDIGGGTTDLSITTFTLDSDAASSARIIPKIELRDGFNIAGDDIVKNIITDHICPAIEAALKAGGADKPAYILSNLFGRDVINQSQESKNLRSRFVRQVFIPVAYGLLAAYENSEPFSGAAAEFTLQDFFLPEGESQPESGTRKHRRPSAQVLGYLEEEARKYCSAPFSLLDTRVAMEPQKIANSIKSVTGQIFESLCEVVHQYNCDVLLLTGRPSRLPGLINELVSKMAVPPDRVVPMCEYRVGAWYPFADVLGQIRDPKTTVSVGAILCALAEGNLEGFSFDTRSLALKPGANYIGEMNNSGQITGSKVWFTVDEKAWKEGELRHEARLNGPISVGFRQFPIERWPTSRLYLVDFTNEEKRKKASGRLPYKLQMVLRLKDIESLPQGEEVDEGELYIEEISDNNDNRQDFDVTVRLQTMPLEEGYWLDTGVIFTV